MRLLDSERHDLDDLYHARDQAQTLCCYLTKIGYPSIADMARETLLQIEEEIEEQWGLIHARRIEWANDELSRNEE